MNEGDADLGSGSGFLLQYNDKQPLLKGVKNPICNGGCSQPIFRVAIRALIYKLINCGQEKSVFQNVLIYLH